jgi:hypothetical protein
MRRAASSVTSRASVFASDLSATGERLVVPSSRKGNTGGLSVQEGFVDREGRPVTRHTVYDSFGTIVHGPHFLGYARRLTPRPRFGLG